MVTTEPLVDDSIYAELMYLHAISTGVPAWTEKRPHMLGVNDVLVALLLGIRQIVPDENQRLYRHYVVDLFTAISPASLSYASDVLLRFPRKYGRID